MLIERQMKRELLRLSKKFPSVTLTGPRQSGKTTLAKMTFPRLPYFSLEDPETRSFATLDPKAFLANLGKGGIIDEIQRVPELPSYLQSHLDDRRKKGPLILTGSHQFEVMEKVAQSLAGRTAILRLLPLSMDEQSRLTGNLSANQILLRGFYPRIHEKKLPPTPAYRSYFETYIERDLRQIVHIKDLRSFRRFVKLCAGRVGQLFVASHFAGELGVSVPTIQSWISVLEASFILFLLEPYHGNIGKRLIKSPKLYFYDVGLASYLLGLESAAQADRDPLRGALFENLVVSDLFKTAFNLGKDPNLYFYRDSNQTEVDLLQIRGKKLIGLEIKSAQTFNEEFLRSLKLIGKTLGSRLTESFVVYGGDREQALKRITLVPYRSISHKLFKIR